MTADLPVEYADEQLHVRMGIEITQWDVQEMVGTMPVKGNRQPFGLLHGGANAVLLSSTGENEIWAGAPARCVGRRG